MQDAGCKFSASPAQHLPRGCSTGREPPISHHCLRFVDGFLHTIIITLSICAPSFEKQWENWNSIYGLYKHVSSGNVWKCYGLQRYLCRKACQFQEETICMLRNILCVKFISSSWSITGLSLLWILNIKHDFHVWFVRVLLLQFLRGGSSIISFRRHEAEEWRGLLMVRSSARARSGKAPHES